MYINFLKVLTLPGKIKPFFAFIALMLVSSHAYAQQGASYRHAERPPTVKELMQWHETFTYQVRYGFFKLGKVRVEIVSDTLYDGQESWHLQSVITSNPGIPFVGHEENHYNTIFRVLDHSFRALEFWTDNVDEDEYKTSQYFFDHKKAKVYANEKDEPPDTLALEEPASSGHLTFYSNRLAAGTDSVVKVPVYLNQEKKYMTLTNTRKTDMREYDAFPGEVKTYYTKGYTDIDGPFGFSGTFDAWYLADDLRVPVEARVKVWLGHVKIRLINYKKERRR